MPRASGDNGGAGGNVLSVVQFDRIRVAITSEAFWAFGDHDLGAKFLRLRISSPGQFPSGNSGWKTKVIFDLRALAGLAPRRFGFDDEHVQSFRRAVNCSGQTT